MPMGGKLTIEMANVNLDEAYCHTHLEAHPGDHVRLAVSDSGCGMDVATQSRIFEPFFTTKGPEKGTGLGLATVFGIVKQSGGHIEVYSELGVGSVFKVYLPREVNGSEPTPIPIQEKAALQGKGTVLVVEDEPGVRNLVRMVLEGHGYTVLVARDGLEGLRVAEQHLGALDLLVTDVIMPGLNGREMAERLQASRPNLRTLFLSGYTDDAIVRHGVLSGEVPFLQKPFTPSDLAQKVGEVLE